LAAVIKIGIMPCLTLRGLWIAALKWCCQPKYREKYLQRVNLGGVFRNIDYLGQTINRSLESLGSGKSCLYNGKIRILLSFTREADEKVKSGGVFTEL